MANFLVTPSTAIAQNVAKSAVQLAKIAQTTAESGAYTKEIALPANLLRVPLMRQATDYTCGVAALQAVLAYYGQDVREDVLARILRANHKSGTRYKNIAEYAKTHGVPVVILKGMTVEQLEQSIRDGHPVLCLIQAWADRGKHFDYADDWNDGHYVVAVGFDNKQVFFMDPSTAAHYTYIPLGEFEKRWHDVDGSEKLNHFGMSFVKSGSQSALPVVTPIE